MRHTLIINPVTTDKYLSYTSRDGHYRSTRHIAPHITLDALPRERLAGILFSKIEIYPGAKIEPEALNWVLSMLRDVKDEPSGIGN